MDDIDNIQYAVFQVGSQGVLIDTGFRSDLKSCKVHIENCNYSFKYREEYVCLPMFRGKRDLYGTND